MIVDKMLYLRSNIMNEIFKPGDRVYDLTDGKGIILDIPGVGYVVKFDSGKTKRITNGGLRRIRQ